MIVEDTVLGCVIQGNGFRQAEALANDLIDKLAQRGMCETHIQHQSLSLYELVKRTLKRYRNRDDADGERKLIRSFIKFNY